MFNNFCLLFLILHVIITIFIQTIFFFPLSISECLLSPLFSTSAIKFLWLFEVRHYFPASHPLQPILPHHFPYNPLIRSLSCQSRWRWHLLSNKAFLSIDFTFEKIFLSSATKKLGHMAESWMSCPIYVAGVLPQDWYEQFGLRSALRVKAGGNNEIYWLSTGRCRLFSSFGGGCLKRDLERHYWALWLFTANVTINFR